LVSRAPILEYLDKPRYITKATRKIMTMEEQIAALTAAVKESRTATDAKFDALQASFDNWKPVVTDLQSQVEALRIKVDRVIPLIDGSSSSTPHATATAPREAEAEQGVRATAVNFGGGTSGYSGPDGHRLQHDTGGSVLGLANTTPPITGVYQILSATAISLGRHESYECRDGRDSHHKWALLKLDFPAFDGENPQFWKAKCEKYFDVYGLQPDL
jgi:hypothetical protein